MEQDIATPEALNQANNFARDISSSIVEWINALSDIGNSAPLDFVIIGGTFAVLLFLAFHLGKDRIIALIFSLYVTLLLFVYFPYADSFIFFDETAAGLVISNVLLFLAFLYIVYKILQRAIDAEYPRDFFYAWFEAILLAIVSTALILAFVYHVLPISALHDFSGAIDQLFADSTTFFWWLVAPFIALFFVLPRRF